MRRRSAARTVVAGLLAGSTIAGCAATTVDPTRTTPVSAGPATPTTIFAPVGPAIELLPELSTEISRLSALVIAGEGDDEALARIDALWAAARDEVDDTRPELIVGFETAIGLAHSAVERRRPADADKSFRNITELVDDYVGDG